MATRLDAAGFGRLSTGKPALGLGLVNADTGLLTGVTEVGTTAGLKIGEKPPNPTDALGGLYRVGQRSR